MIAYFSLCAHLLLPDSVSRVLYIDAGDVIILDDIMPYYNCDFNDKALIVTAARYKLCNNEPVSYEETDIDDLNEGFPSICRGIFNSGSYVMNLNKIRADNLLLTISSILHKFYVIILVKKIPRKFTGVTKVSCLLLLLEM